MCARSLGPVHALHWRRPLAVRHCSVSDRLHLDLVSVPRLPRPRRRFGAQKVQKHGLDQGMRTRALLFLFFHCLPFLSPEGNLKLRAIFAKGICIYVLICSLCILLGLYVCIWLFVVSAIAIFSCTTFTSALHSSLAGPRVRQRGVPQVQLVALGAASVPGQAPVAVLGVRRLPRLGQVLSALRAALSTGCACD
jgi:hypothetical protein